MAFINLPRQLRNAAARGNHVTVLFAPALDVAGTGLPTLPFPMVEEYMMTERPGWGSGIIYRAGRTFLVSADICLLDEIKKYPKNVIVFVSGN
jgi:hypothetical protein